MEIFTRGGDKKSVAILGSGLAGLAASIRLAHAGFTVSVFEKNSYPGGKLTEFQKDGYRFDAGPSLLTMPNYITEVLSLAGNSHADKFRYRRLRTVCHYFWPDGSRFSAPADSRELIAGLAELTGCDPKKIAAYLHNSKLKYELTGTVFTEKSLHRLSTWLSGSVVKALAHLHRFDLMRTMHQTHVKRLGHPKLVQMFDRYATYNGSNPYKAPGMLTLIPHLEHHVGAFLPEGGMHDVTQSLFEAAKSMGVTFHFETAATGLEVAQKKVIHLKTEHGTHSPDAILSNMDVWYTYKKLLPAVKHPEKILRQKRSTSALIFYWGVRSEAPGMDVHNILWAEDYAAEFEAIAEKGELYHDPTIYVNITSRMVPGDAPQGCTNWFVMVNVPHGNVLNSEEAIHRVRTTVLDKIETLLGIPVKQLIDTEEWLTPHDIDHKTGSYRGSLYGTSSDSTLAAFLRHPNFTRRVKNLYFAGGSVHPGGGIPLCLQSAKIASALICEQHNPGS